MAGTPKATNDNKLSVRQVKSFDNDILQLLKFCVHSLHSLSSLHHR
ncbi:hypothetical protein CWATWH8502_4553 [Crocosphaera watsonii WH 8502]|uniref:Uncharacterized protein n=1 Tax=Crocosphaera watsonii WH 8502 TaxID=423474 RepID=T2IA16_CROWT|nr:hypothetical protein CWATWH8502_4553 [Crocosphaera watsonii WH 8502]